MQTITVEYWPNTDKWRILVAGVAVGYWSTKEEAETRARQARRELTALDNAAPVLLAACEAAVEHMQVYDRLYSMEERELYDELRAAIAKARGA